MMNEMIMVLLASIVGAMLGVIFFGGLWWTIQKGLTSHAAPFWFLGSLILRTSLVVLGFYLVAHRDWRQLVACVLGFLIGRIGVTFLLRMKGGQRCA